MDFPNLPDGVAFAGHSFIRNEKTNAKDIIEFGKKTLKETGKITPQVFLEAKRPDGYLVTTGVLFFNTYKEKKESLKIIRKLTQKMNADSCYILFEAWVTKTIPGDLPYIRPTQNVDREECLFATEFKRTMEHMPLLTLPFKKEGEKVKFGKLNELKDGKEFTSMWNPFVELEGVEEAMDKNINETNKAFFEKQATKLKDKYWKRIKGAKTDEDRKSVLMEMVTEMEQMKHEIDKRIYEDADDGN